MTKRNPTGGEPVEPGNADELSSVTAQVTATIEPEPSAEPSAEDDLVDIASDKLHDLATKPGELDATIDQLTEEELASLLELGFGLVADHRGPHWELTARSSARLAKWLKLCLVKYPTLWKWLEDKLPIVALSGLVSYEVWVRVKIDREQKAAREKKAKPQEAPGEKAE